MGLTREAFCSHVEGLHKMAAMLSGQPMGQFIELSAPEAEMLGGALYDVAEEYGITLSGPRAVWIKLAAAVGMVYGPRVIGIMQLNNARRRANGARPAQDATPSPVPGAMPPINYGGMQ